MNMKNLFLFFLLLTTLIVTQPAQAMAFCQRWHIPTWIQNTRLEDLAIGTLTALAATVIGMVIHHEYREYQSIKEYKAKAQERAYATDINNLEKVIKLTQKHAPVYEWVVTNNQQALQQFIIQNHIESNPYQAFVTKLQRAKRFIGRISLNMRDNKKISENQKQERIAQYKNLKKMIQAIWVYCYEHFSNELSQQQS